jgi:hypothetical protein
MDDSHRNPIAVMLLFILTFAVYWMLAGQMAPETLPE